MEALLDVTCYQTFLMSSRNLKPLLSMLALLKPVPHLKPPEVFDAVLPLVVTTAVELVLIREKKALLTWRSDEFFRGRHFPGVIMGVGETFEDAARRIAKNELGVALGNIRVYDVVNSPPGKANKRSHVVSLLVCASIAKGTPRQGEWFSRAPKELLAVHRQMWKKVAPLLSRRAAK